MMQKSVCDTPCFRKQASIPSFRKAKFGDREEYTRIAPPDLSHAGGPQNSNKYDSKT
jgi:hypothetical protein